VSDASNVARVMVALFDVPGRAPPVLSWALDGQPINGGGAPQPLRGQELEPVCNLPGVATETRTYTGIYDLRLSGSVSRQLSVALSTGQSASTSLRVLPPSLPLAGRFDVLLASCFYAPEANADLNKTLRQARDALPRRSDGSLGPDCSFFMGDQVYLDNPLSEDVPETAAGAFALFESKYRKNWSVGLAELLQAGPAIHLSDDHEFWNNYPFPYLLARNTQGAPTSDYWRSAALRMLTRFQDAREYRRIDVSPLSFFLADGRMQRDSSLAYAITPTTRQRLSAWVDDLNANPEFRVAVFVTGQSLLSEPARHPKGQVADAEPTNFEDYDLVLRELYRVKCKLILVTGDVHWGRVTLAKRLSRGDDQIHEVIVSPLSSVRDPRLRALNTLRFISRIDKSFRGDSNLPKQPPAELGFQRAFRSGELPERARCSLVARSDAKPALFRGDQLAMLSFERTGANKVSACVHYWMMASKPVTYRVPLFDVKA
jgi:hypothetical protein